MKVIKVSDTNYKLLLEIIHKMEKETSQRASFDDALTRIIDVYDQARDILLNMENK